MRSAIYEGTVVHHRLATVDHRFSYRIAMPFVDLDEIDDLCRLHPLWSAERPNVVSYRRRDFLPDRPGPLADAVRDLVAERLGCRPRGPVAMLGHLRTWGWLFNPITLYYCFDPEGVHVESLVAEVTNTPWHERHVYVVGGPGRHRFQKELHVSPFFDSDMDYELSYREPGEHLGLSMRNVRGGETLFGAGLRLERHEADRRALGRLVWSHRLMTMRVSAGIYRQAAALRRAGAPIVPHPSGRPLSRALVTGLGRHLRHGTLVLEDARGVRTMGAGEPRARVRVHDPVAYAALARHGSVGLAESYVDGLWDSDDLTDLVRILAAHRGAAGRARDRAGQAASVLTDPVRRLRRRPPSQDRRDVRAHYDIGNELFALMLDPTLSYSCALFERPGMTLEEASLAKLDRICQKLDLSPADHVVEIGTGWGGFAVHAATRYGCRVTSTTISSEQYAHARDWVARAGVSDRVTILEEDYRNLRGQYDKLVSIEMVEAVDWRVLDTYFRTCAALLRPAGLMALQAITIADQSYERAKNSTDFIKAYIFPGSCLPSVSSLARAAARTDLRVVDLEDIGRHYAETLRRWRDNVDEHASAIHALGFDERFVRMWRFYLSYCEGAFLERHISDVQLVLAKPGWRAPLLLRP
ncbi:MAG: DUF1365 family protein [Actinomycetota bacterium]|nr:DUF1365 family protein [Actinomycetota bacterium]